MSLKANDFISSEESREISTFVLKERLEILKITELWQHIFNFVLSFFGISLVIINKN